LGILRQELDTQRTQTEENESSLQAELKASKQSCTNLQEELDAVVARKDEEIQKLLVNVSNHEDMTRRQKGQSCVFVFPDTSLWLVTLIWFTF
jgi:hypothetical protein